MQLLGSAGLLLFLAAGCSDVEIQAEPDEVEGASIEELLDEIDGGRRTGVVGSTSLARLEDCELSEVQEDRLRAAEEALEQLLLQYTERHPDVVAAQGEYDRLIREALSDCVERIQSR